MSILIDANQARLISSKRLAAKKRPKYYNAQLSEKTIISEDFEAFLILQGRPRNKETVNWLQKAADYAIQDADRDSLINTCLSNEIADADAAYKELSPIVEQFSQFRQRYNMTGFEGVVEAGQLLADLQRPMGEIMALGTKHKNRSQCGKLIQKKLSTGGVTSNQSKQLNSWFEALTTY